MISRHNKVLNVASQPSHISAPSTSSTMTGLKGSYASTFPSAPPYPDSTGDVNMESSADKRSREAPDSTLKTEGKSLKTFEVATATSTEDVASNLHAQQIQPHLMGAVMLTPRKGSNYSLESKGCCRSKAIREADPSTHSCMEA